MMRRKSSAFKRIIPYRGITMKNLLIIRHAEAGWDDTIDSDRDRLLSEQGEKDAPFMGRRLHDQGLMPDRILSSPARRALATAHAVAGQVGYEASHIDVHGIMYMQGMPALMKLVQTLPDTWQRVYLIAHNPDLEWLTGHLTGENFRNMPTCGIASIEFDLPSWGHIMAGSGKLAFFDHPGRHLSRM